MLEISHCVYNGLTDGGEVVSHTRRPRSTPQKYLFLLSIHTYNEYMYACNGWANIYPALALRPLRSIVLPLLVYPLLNPTLVMKRRASLMGASW
jgi:hypothetical protein